MAWRAQYSSVTGATIVTDVWPDLALLPQPVFHRDELRLLKAAAATPRRYADVAWAKRIFRGAWVVSATKPLRTRRKRGFFERRQVRPLPMAEEDDE